MLWVIFLFYLVHPSLTSSVWYYECTEGFCVKTFLTPNTTSSLSFGECNVLCLDSAGVWPKPINITLTDLVEISFTNITFTTQQNTTISTLVASAFEIFQSEIRKLLPCDTFFQTNNSVDFKHVTITFDISDQTTQQFTFGVDESYTIQTISSDSGDVELLIEAETFYGARNALETIVQLVVFDDIRDRVLFPSDLYVKDGPVFSWRGVALDTSRNYVPPKAIRRTLRAMAASKLNTFHWHLTDTASFPYVSKSHPELSQIGAYTSQKVYTDDAVRQIVAYANVRGIRVVPELDAPAHVGEGWQNTGVVTCFNMKPWADYCVEPPCGQFDPSKEDLYDILEDLYGDLLDQFGTNVFHMGGDEVNVNCWNSTTSLTEWMIEEKNWTLTSTSFYEEVWPYFQNQASERLYKKAGKEIPIILWTSDLTSLTNVEDILPPSKYIIQVWDSKYDSTTQTLLSKNYSIILSNYDALYLDCGFSGWVTDGNNWCSPYKGWQLIYDNRIESIAGDWVSQVLGAESPLWTEQSGPSSLDTRLWPRAAALAENLWSSQDLEWRDAEERMLLHRNRLVSLGVNADELEPEWCLRNQQHCPTTGKLNI